MAKVWDRQDLESAVAYQAFCAYRDLGTGRSIDAVVQKLDKSRTLIGRWSGDWNWVERCRAYDDYTERQARAEKEKRHRADLVKFGEQQRKEARRVRATALKLLTKLEERIDKIVDANDIRVGDMAGLMRSTVSALEQAAEAEAASLGIHELSSDDVSPELQEEDSF